MSLAIQVIKFEEGFRSVPYYDTEGIPTVGYGRVVGKKGDPLPEIVVDEESELQFVVDRTISIQKEIPEILEPLNPARRAVVISMAYQLGVKGLKKFKKFLAAISRHDWIEAEIQMLDSLWAKQTPDRARRHSLVILSGSLKAVKEYENFHE